jgi:hypothetical protein
MATTRRVVNVFSDSTGFDSFNYMAWREFLFLLRPDLIASGTVHDVQIGPQSVSAAVPSLWHGDNRSWHSCTNGITIGGMAAVVGTRLLAVSPASSLVIAHLGMNNALGGDNAANMLTEANTFITNVRATSGFATVPILFMQMMNQLLSAPAQTVINTYNAGVPAVVAGHSNCYTHPMPTNLQAHHFGDVQRVHENAWGASLMAAAVAAGLAAAGL